MNNKAEAETDESDETAEEIEAEEEETPIDDDVVSWRDCASAEPAVSAKATELARDAEEREASEAGPEETKEEDEALAVEEDACESAGRSRRGRSREATFWPTEAVVTADSATSVMSSRIV